jgi:hypothetical protein
MIVQNTKKDEGAAELRVREIQVRTRAKVEVREEAG